MLVRNIRSNPKQEVQYESGSALLVSLWNISSVGMESLIFHDKHDFTDTFQ